MSSEALGVQPVFVCPSDFGWVSRPRLWWLSIEWTCLVSYPDDGSPLEWAKKGRWDRLRLAAARASADSFDLGGLAFHSSVAQGRKLMPCATTPAPTDDGRAKPRSTRGRTPRDADARWLEGGRQFAPWHYTVEAMLQDARGVLHIPPPEVKEQLHHMPPGYTAKAGADAKTRHRMVGNGWHWGVASRLLGLLVMTTWAKPAHAGALFLGCRGWDFAPPPGRLLRSWARASTRTAIGRPRLACSTLWSAGRPWSRRLKPSLSSAGSGATISLASARTSSLISGSLSRTPKTTPPRGWRLCPRTCAPLTSLRTGPGPFRALCLIACFVGYPAADDLQQDVNLGFDMLGSVRPAPGWRPRSDERYAHPEGLDRLRRENPPYVARRSARPRDQEHTQALLDELVADDTTQPGVIGPCAAPDHWAVPTVALPSVTGMGVLRQPPPGDCFAALSFAICQVDEHGELKLRRGEDWRRSGHNATMGASDVPTHHFLGDIVDLVLPGTASPRTRRRAWLGA